MEDLLRSKGLYRITLGKEKTPTDDDKKAKWANRSDEARGLIGKHSYQLNENSPEFSFFGGSNFLPHF
jgi:hypothetical protein